ncbi:hypothetical protein [Flavobacterium hungaricum]|uniref:hypothetical protein n=1 Tax=Flavobacterium hungaricum TaxID=2082725 RepID=UPI0018839C15|nr:hypothetical protein [Flavobacterium hungaricum]
MKEREKLHVAALKRWIIESNFETIIICDNSGYVYSEQIVSLAFELGKVVEVLSFKGDTKKVEELGKGYGEGEIMNYILNNSIYIKKHEYFFKITGKLFVENIEKFIALKNIDFAFDHSYSFFWKSNKISCVFTNFYFANLNSFKSILKNEYLKVKDYDGFFLEHAYALALQNHNKLNVISILPYITGISGSTGVNYSKKRKMINFLKKLLSSLSLVRKF